MLYIEVHMLKSLINQNPHEIHIKNNSYFL
jgi:hypothetical protein